MELVGWSWGRGGPRYPKATPVPEGLAIFRALQASTTSPSMSIATSISSILEELDRAIVENGLVATHVENGSSDESSIFELRTHLQQQLEVHVDLDMNQIQLNWAGAPLPSWLPRTVTDAMGLTSSLSASQALSKAIAKPRHRDISAITSAVDKALSIKSTSERSFQNSEPARPSGLAAAQRSGISPHASGPSSTTTLMTTTIHDHNHDVSRNQTQRFSISTRSRASGSSSKGAARAQLELELARAKEARIEAELQALDSTSSRHSEKDSDIDSLADRLSLAGLSSHPYQRSTAPPPGKGAARSQEPGGRNVETAEVSHQFHDVPIAGNHHETNFPHESIFHGLKKPESPMQLPIRRPASLPPQEEPMGLMRPPRAL